LNIRSRPLDGAYAEYQLRRRDSPDPHGFWLPGPELPPDLCAAFNYICDAKDNYGGYEGLTAEQRKACFKNKNRCNKYYCDFVKEAALLNGEPGHHIALIHPKEGACTSKELVEIGIPVANIHQPNPFAFAKCCGLGYPNIYKCYLGDLPKHLPKSAPIFSSIMADFCGCCDGHLEQLEQCFAGLRKTKFFAISLTLCHCRHQKDKFGADWDQLNGTQDLVVAMLSRYGYVIHGLSRVTPYKVDQKAKMFNWAFLFRLALEVQTPITYSQPSKIATDCIEISEDESEIY
jgi:hypothetical protein